MRDAIRHAREIGVEVYYNKKGEITFRALGHPVCPVYATNAARHDAGLGLISWLRRWEAAKEQTAAATVQPSGR